MIEVNSTVYALAWGVLILLAVINCAMIFYAVYTKLEALENHFDEWLYLTTDWRSSGGSFHWRSRRMAEVSRLITSKSIQRQEPLLIDAVQQLPRGLRFWATCPFHVGYFVCGGTSLLWLYGKYRGFL
ncbi:MULTISPECIES: hypothetical protein [unclassified Pseudomonas]|uniref:hypothetical protein n=1 Tax=unclassified Pseudomonas TaxID=196821 RepID=UPI000A1FA14A|nr:MULTISPECIES: hypothetical protein [unclassified Pseudomonas]MCX4216293.1 hypothetical protein [Pseudomonas sp. MCal1]